MGEIVRGTDPFSSVEPESRPERFNSPYNKIVSEEVAISQIENWRLSGLKVVIAEAVLEIPHYRHADYFLACANLGDKLLVRINSDSLIASRKDPRGPIVPWVERAKHAVHYPYIDLITSKSDTGGGWLRIYRPDVVVKSITSPMGVVNEALGLRSDFTQLGIKLVIMDQFAHPVPIERYLEQSEAYHADEFGPDKFSGSIIKREIEKRAIEDHLKSRSGD